MAVSKYAWNAHWKDDAMKLSSVWLSALSVIAQKGVTDRTE